MPGELSDAEKDLFKRLAADRRARGIRLGKWSVMMDTAAIETVDTLWESWVRALGKQKAVDNLVEAMGNQHELIRSRIQYEIEEKNRGRRPQSIKDSAPKLSDDGDGRDDDGEPSPKFGPDPE
jgi:hypothetical protein